MRFGGRMIPRGYEVLRCDDLEIGIGGKVLLENVNIRLLSGDKLGVVGPNGAGKTTLLKVLAGILNPLAGTVHRHPKVDFLFFSQEVEGLVPGRTVCETGRAFGGDKYSDEEIRSHLALFLFSGNDAEKMVETLSGGEARRLILASLTLKPAGVLLLDEPTNHLDIPARESLEKALNEFPGSAIIVSHDRRFLDNVATGILFVDPPGVEFYPGKWSDAFLLKEKRRKGGKPVEQGRKKPAAAQPRKRTRKLNVYKLEKLEQAIFALEDEKKSLEESMGTPAVYMDGERLKEVKKRIGELERELEGLYKEWEEISGRE